MSRFAKKLHNKKYMITLSASVFLLASLLILFWSLLSPLSWENTDFWLKITSGILAGLTFVVGTLAIISGYYLGERQKKDNEIQAQKISTQEENTERLKGDNLQLESRVEKERIFRLKLEESLKPRTLTVNGYTFDRFRAFAGTPFVIDTDSDDEAFRVAGLIRSVLLPSGWNEIAKSQVSSQPEGVEVETLVINNTPDSRTSPSAALLLEFLEANGWEVNNRGAMNYPNLPPRRAFNGENIPNDTVRIRVGIKPTSYFWKKSLNDALDEDTQKYLEDSENVRKEKIGRLREEWSFPPLQP